MKRNADGTWPSTLTPPIEWSSVNYTSPSGWIVVNTNSCEYRFMCYDSQWYAQKVQHLFPHKGM